MHDFSGRASEAVDWMAIDGRAPTAWHLAYKRACQGMAGAQAGMKALVLSTLRCIKIPSLKAVAALTRLE